MRRGLLPVLLVVLVACGGGDDGPSSDPEPSFEVAQAFSGGPVTLVIRLSSADLGLADSLVLEEEVRAEAGFVAELPEFSADDFEGLGVVDVDETPSRTEDGITTLRRRLVLEPERSGTIAIPAREAWFHRESEQAESSVASTPVEIDVAPIEDAAALELPAPRPILRPEEVLAARGLSPWWWTLLAIPTALAGLLLWRRRRRPEPPPRPAHELAWEALRRLAAARLLENGETDRFFVVLSAILREYVERRFGVRAPERTTREFLAEAAAHPGLGGHEERLAAFLTLADRVKFARHEPEDTSIQTAFDATKAFVEATQEEARA